MVKEIQADSGVDIKPPYVVEFTLRGTVPILFNRWSDETADAKDNLESCLYRDAGNNICIPGEYVRRSIIQAAKYWQDPRNPESSAVELFREGIVSLTGFASLGSSEYDFIDKRRAVVQGDAVTRMRPAMNEGWQAAFRMQVLIPEYIGGSLFQEVLTQAGVQVGIGDFRPTFGRFEVTSFEVTSAVQKSKWEDLSNEQKCQ